MDPIDPAQIKAIASRIYNEVWQGGQAPPVEPASPCGPSYATSAPADSSIPSAGPTLRDAVPSPSGPYADAAKTFADRIRNGSVTQGPLPGFGGLEPFQPQAPTNRQPVYRARPMNIEAIRRDFPIL